MRHNFFSRLASLALAWAILFAALPAASGAAFAPPTAASFSTAVAVSAQTVIQLQGADVDGTPLTFATTSTPANGALSNLNTATGVVVFTPTVGWTGTTSFTYTVTSGGETSAPATVTITVTAAKTRVIDTLTNPNGTPRQGKVSFFLSQTASSPGGLIPAKASVSAQLNTSGQFDVSLYPSSAVSPVQFYQMWFDDAVTRNTQLLGVYRIPASTTTISLTGHRITDANLGAQFQFASKAEVDALTAAVAAATTAQLYPSLTAGRHVLWNGLTFANSIVSESGSAATVAGSLSVTGGLNVTGSVTGAVKSVNGRGGAVTLQSSDLNGLSGAGLTGIGTGTGGVINTGSTTLGADSPPDGVGAISIQTREIERIGVANDGTVNFTGAVTKNGASVLSSGAGVVSALGAAPAAFTSAHLTHGSNQPLTNDGVFTTVAFNTELKDTGEHHSTSSNNSRLVCTSPADVIFAVQIYFSSTSASPKYVRIFKNGTTEIADDGSQAAGADERITLAAQDSCFEGDYYEVQAYRLGGGTTTIAAANAWAPVFSAIFLRTIDTSEAAVWAKLPSNPVIVPQGTETAAFEPDVVVVSGIAHLYFTAGSMSTTFSVYHATFDGTTFTRLSKVVGNGTGGESGNAVRPGIYYESGTYYLTYADGIGTSCPDKIKWATATNPDGPFTVQGTLLNPAAPLACSLANTKILKDGSTYYLFVEGRAATTADIWQTGVATAPSVGGPYTLLPTLQTTLGTGAGMYGGPNPVRIGSTYYNWYHRAVSGLLPTEVWRAQSTSLTGNTWTGHTPSWRIGAQETNNYRALPIFGASFTPDQTADPTVFELGGKSYICVDVDDNTGTYQAGISCASYNGTLQQLVGRSSP